MGMRTGLPVLCLAATVLGSVPARAAGPEGDRFFREKIAPVLEAECYRCHSAEAEKVKGGLRLDSREGLLRGGDTGPAVVPGKSGESLLSRPSATRTAWRCRPRSRSSPSRRSPTSRPGSTPGRPDSVRRRGPRADGRSPMQQARRHWAFQPVREARAADGRATRPGCRTRSTPSSWRSSKSAAGSPRRRPSAREWLRRVTFDLTGLPPSPEEIEAFVADTSPIADERVVDRLLASPRYGERWAQHWLDVVRLRRDRGVRVRPPHPRRLAVSATT